ncbi:hypothetical protein CLAFUW4_11109 [Fulvia fulva]|uniref:uncharacterized protein n=1 Tax=Passalora fulva TaxID=5499 RepID=UPI0004E9C8EB|nr:uncharacterized protein CLAFUR5_20304 [Fulvia fulva]KAK4620103.1 hypothetical protein CLAFUR4_11114 [Fulvia fulva]KAK4620268.1 hypothetical protein CLAFUR0_11120 [Fulvia fulva]WMI38951.1 hypothetical protein CLAFUR5_20304 [Fulvia fulva]WPV17281.1 hypothetical protein CLAFUW4_11109 [Fulvia fulva]WPV31788.1 hypothetical protein CLAFUW7_11105 [Fulvia fulva]
MAASAAVFAIPELVENILEHLPALTLFKLRQINSTFDDTIKQRRFRAAMLLEPSDRLSLFRLVRLLQSSNLQRALRPFKILSVHTILNGQELQMNVGTSKILSPKNIDRTLAQIESQVVPCSQRDASWRKIRLDRGLKNLSVDFWRPGPCALPLSVNQHYTPPEVNTIGAVVDEAVAWLAKGSERQQRKLYEAEIFKRTELMGELPAGESGGD